MKIRFSNFEFDRSTGELTQSTNEKVTVSRLPPQPSQLLELLLKSYPNIASHQAIGEELWPGISVDYEANLHFCIRQIRSALNDSASDPKFVETIPRRGYRWIAEFNCNDEDQSGRTTAALTQLAPRPLLQAPSDTDEPVVDHAASQVHTALNDKENDFEEVPPDLSMESAVKSGIKLDSPVNNPPKRRVRDHRWFQFAVLVLAAMVCLSFLMQTIFKSQMISSTETTESPRIAIMPFTTSNPDFKSIGTGEIGWGILEQLELAKFRVVGPTTTSRFNEQPQLMKDLIDEFKIDLIVNGKFFLKEGKPVMLAEIIRAADGAHIWVNRFASSSSHAEITRSIVNAIHNILTIQ